MESQSPELWLSRSQISRSAMASHPSRSAAAMEMMEDHYPGTEVRIVIREIAMSIAVRTAIARPERTARNLISKSLGERRQTQT